MNSFAKNDFRRLHVMIFTKSVAQCIQYKLFDAVRCCRVEIIKNQTVTDQNKVTTKESSSERRASIYRGLWGTAGLKHTAETYRQTVTVRVSCATCAHGNPSEHYRWSTLVIHSWLMSINCSFINSTVCPPATHKNHWSSYGIHTITRFVHFCCFMGKNLWIMMDWVRWASAHRCFGYV